jgi:hypothetical protein
MLSIPRFQTLGQYHDAWSTVLLFAPDDFRSFDVDEKPIDQRARLDSEFSDLRDGFHFAEKKLKDARMSRICRELLDMSYEAYVSGDAKLGAHTLQECEGLIWKGRQLPVKYAVEAERRAFGDLLLFKDVVISPYPYEGTEQDLGDVQRLLWKHADRISSAQLEESAGFKTYWAMQNDGSIHEMKVKSGKEAKRQWEEGIASGKVIGAAYAQLLVGGGLLIYHVEQAGKPLIAIMNLFRDGVRNPPRFHLNDPVLFKNLA